MWGHRQCAECGKVGHKQDMIKMIIGLDLGIKYLHESCYCKAYKRKRCPCGSGWIDSEEDKCKTNSN